MERGETIDLSSMSKVKARKIIRENSNIKIPFLLNPRSIYRCSGCGEVVVRVSMPNVEITENLNEKPYCYKCKIKDGSLIEMEIRDKEIT